MSNLSQISSTTKPQSHTQFFKSHLCLYLYCQDIFRTSTNYFILVYCSFKICASDFFERGVITQSIILQILLTTAKQIRF